MPRPASRVGARPIVLAAIAVCGVWATLTLGIDEATALPGTGGLDVAVRFLVAALTPALDYESTWVPPGARPLLLEALDAAARTVFFAAAAMSLVLVAGSVLGIVASSAWWSDDALVAGPLGRTRRWLARALHGLARTGIALLRSVHELIWAVLFLCAFGRSEAAAILAIAIPFTGTQAKVLSELIDEAPREAGAALRGAGASRLTTFCFGLLPRAVPDMAAYSFYRFECALRSAAVLGFFGYPTLGQSIRLAYENTHHREVWTYLYTLFALVAVFESWSGALRRRLVR